MKALILTLAIALGGCSLATVNTSKTHKQKCTESEVAPVFDFILVATALGLRLYHESEREKNMHNTWNPVESGAHAMRTGAFYSTAIVAGASGAYGAYHVENCQNRKKRKWTNK